jgi:hypothetical protein
LGLQLDPYEFFHFFTIVGYIAATPVVITIFENLYSALWSLPPNFSAVTNKPKLARLSTML